MKKLLFLFLIPSITVQAQNFANFWYFGMNAGIQFTATGPVALTSGALQTSEGCATISDNNGALMFYTDGVSVWNKAHVPMVNGTGLLAGTSSTQAALIVPDPANSNKYYIFTTDEIGGPNGFRYSKVDMSLQGGMGEVDSATKNTLLLNNVTEKLTATQHSNGVDYWVTVHEWGTASFYSYLVTASGIQPPVISTTGSIHSNSVIQNTYGQMKFSPCGNRLALAVSYQDIVELFDFDKQSGIVSNPVTLNFSDHVYGLEFSQDQIYLYVTGYDPSATLMQFDISSGNATAIMGTMFPVSTIPDLRALQIGPDAKIYVARSFVSFVGCINDPSVATAGCNYNDMAINVDPLGMGTLCAIGLPGFVSSWFSSEMVCEATGIAEQASENHYVIVNDPSLGVSFIHFKAELPDLIEIMDISGRNIYTEKSPVAGDFHLPAGHLNVGIYLVRMSWSNQVFTARLQVY